MKLSMKAQQVVVVGEGLHRLLKVTVLEVRDGCVKLGFEADDDLHILRSEIWRRLCPVVDPQDAPADSVLVVA